MVLDVSKNIVTHILGRPLILYTIALGDSSSALFAQTNEEEKENMFYNFSYHLIPTEAKYFLMEKHYMTHLYDIKAMKLHVIP